jgi:hypothetical protein
MVVFQDASTLTADDINLVDLQQLYVDQETSDTLSLYPNVDNMTADASTLSQLVSADASTTVTSRLGQTYPSALKLTTDLTNQIYSIRDAFLAFTRPVPVEQTFVAGVDFTPGTTTTLTTTQDMGDKSVLMVFFGAAFQSNSDSVSTYASRVITFKAPIPVGVSEVIVRGTVAVPVLVAQAQAPGSITDGALSPASKLSRRVDSFVDVTDPQFGGCDKTGAADCTASVQAAINYALAHSVKGVYFPAGTFRFFAASAPLDPGVGNLSFFGDGSGSSILLHEEGASLGAFHERKHLFAHVDDSVMKGALSFRDLQFKGTWAEGGYVDRGGCTFALNYYHRFTVVDCLFTNKSWMNMSNEYILITQIMNNEFDTCTHDMARVRSSWNVLIADNVFRYCDDNAIALHQANFITGTGNIRESMIVSGNILEDTCGISILGGRNVIVSDNILRRSKDVVISISSDSQEGVNPMFAVSVRGNHIFDSMVRPVSFPANQFACIAINYGGVYGTPTGSPAPAENYTASSTFLLPYAFRDVQGGSTFPGMFAVNVKDNIIMRTLPAVAAYSSWGVGQCFTDSGWVNPPVTDAEMRPAAGIVLQSDTRAFQVEGNTIQGCYYGVILDAPSRNFSAMSSVIRGNVIYDCVSGGVSINTPAAVRTIQLRISDNEFNLDPYHLSTNRGTAGSWSANGGPYGIVGDSIQGLLVERNVFSNLCNPLSGSNSSMWLARDNIVRGQPNSTGFNTNNKGVGNIPAIGARFVIDNMFSDPTQANYLTPMNTTFFANEASAMPASGFWTAGMFVRNVGSAAVFGWSRQTTGSANVAGVDWKTVALS